MTVDQAEALLWLLDVADDKVRQSYRFRALEELRAEAERVAGE